MRKYVFLSTLPGTLDTSLTCYHRLKSSPLTGRAFCGSRNPRQLVSIGGNMDLYSRYLCAGDIPVCFCSCGEVSSSGLFCSLDVVIASTLLARGCQPRYVGRLPILASMVYRRTYHTAGSKHHEVTSVVSSPHGVVRPLNFEQHCTGPASAVFQGSFLARNSKFSAFENRIGGWLRVEVTPLPIWDEVQRRIARLACDGVKLPISGATEQEHSSC